MGLKIHVTPGVDARAAARDLMRDVAVGIEDIGENLYDVIRDEILEELGFEGDGLDLRTDRVETAIGPVFVTRERSAWTAATAKKAVLSQPLRS